MSEQFRILWMTEEVPTKETEQTMTCFAKM